MTAPPLLSLHDRDELEAFLRRDPLRHVYALGDLDPFFWERTVWFGLREGGQLSEVCLLYLSVDRPTLLGFASGPLDRMRTLLLTVDQIALNVHATNTAAVACYQALGFEPVLEYFEFLADPA
jgi:hypothetical protein